MVRRIQSDSDFDSDEDISISTKVLSPVKRISPLPTPHSSPREPPRSSRRIIRGKKSEAIDHGTYDYDSDIYTDGSSLGSFIVYTDEFETPNASQDEDSDIDESVSSFSIDVSKLSLSTNNTSLDNEAASTDESLSGATLVHYPELNPRKQTADVDDIISSSPRRFRLLLSPYKEATSQFWNKTDHFKWIDQHSPVKSVKEDTKIQLTDTKKEVKEFAKRREQMARDLVKDIDATVMEGKLAASTAKTGGVKLIWSGRLRSTAGNAHWKPARGIAPHNGVEQHNLSIKLSPSIITDEGKLRNTLAHELCHCACFVIDNDRQSHHGPPFKRWASKIMAAFPDILITRTHSYEINNKYQFACTNPVCGVTFGRQKRMELTRKVCGRCKSPFIQTKPVRKTSGKENKPNAFGMFIKERFAEVKKRNPGSPHKEIMGMLSREYHQTKAGSSKKLEVKEKSVEAIEIESDDEVVELTATLGSLKA